MLNAGIVNVDADRKWIGGLYYLHHLVRCVAALPEDERVRLFDVWWRGAPESDPFADVRPLLAGRRVLGPPSSLPRRIVRRVRRALHGWSDARDLFLDAGIDVLFPIAPCALPGVPFVFWIPDFQYRHLPDLFSPEMRDWYDWHYGGNGRAADLIAVSSESGRQDLIRFFPALAEKARVLRFSSVPAEEWWRCDPAEVAEKHALPEKFFILSNQFSHHKNHLVAFDAVRRLRDEHGLAVTVACTGSTYGFRGDDYMQRVDAFLDEHALREQIRILGLIPREEQIALTRRALATLQPSRFEGWSTVVEDAKALGKPILLSDLDVHREQAPQSVTYLPLDDSAAWAARMAETWSAREPGPHADEETAGRDFSERARLATGRTFAAILNEAVTRRR